MNYYNDITCIWGNVLPECRAVIDGGWPDLCNLHLKTRGEMEFGVDGSVRELFGPHDAVLFWHHPLHRFQYRPGTSGSWEHHWVTFRGPRALRILEQGFMALSPDFRLRIADPEPFGLLFRELVDVVLSENLDPLRKSAKGLVLIERVLNLAWEEKCSQRFAVPKSRQRLTQVEQALRERTNRSTDVYAIARRMGFSDAHFRRLFRANYGVSPHQYLLHLVMQRAARQLVSSDHPVSLIGSNVGYEDPAQFSKAFRKLMGQSPQQWRNHHQLLGKR